LALYDLNLGSSKICDKPKRSLDP